MYHNTPAYGSTAYYDPDLLSLGAGNGTVYDGIALSFDLTPTLSGPVTFRCHAETPLHAWSGMQCADTGLQLSRHQHSSLKSLQDCGSRR